jgi:hypothetical protein
MNNKYDGIFFKIVSRFPNCKSITSCVEFIYELELAAERQINRIYEDIENIISYKRDNNDNLKGIKEKYSYLFIDINFYSIIWRDINQAIVVINKETNELGLKKIYDKKKKVFDSYIELRNSFAHYDERLPGQKNEGRIKEVTVDGAGPRKINRGFTVDYKYKHSNQLWDVSKNSLVELKSFLKEYLDYFKSLL